MNKTVLAAIAVIVAMLGITYLAVGTAGGVGGDGGLVNKLAVLGAVALVIITVFVVTKYVRQMQTDRASGKLADDNWDGIGEYTNELPFGWAIIFLGVIVWSGWYMLSGYPLNAYSQIGEYNEEVAVHDAKFEAEHKNMDPETLKEMGGSVFIVQCAPCHGLQADGIDGKAANLTHRLEEKSIKHVITNGANNFKTDYAGGMPPMLLQDPAQVNAVAKYVASGFKADDVAGKAAFLAGTCNTCHGENGEGVPSVAPKINGWDAATVATVLKNGKKGAIGTMPALTNLTDVQVKALGAYVTDLSK